LVPGGGGAAILDGFAAPLGPLPALPGPPGLVGPDGTPLIPDVPTPAEPVLGEPAVLPLPVDEPLGLCANEFTGETRIAIAAITVADDRFIENLPLPFNDSRTRMFPDGTISGTDHCELYSSLRRSR
jgi:hypothetical protein